MQRIPPKTILLDLSLVIGLPVILTLAFGLLGALRPDKVISRVTPLSVGLAYEHVALATSDKVAIAGWFIPKKGSPTKTAVIVLHGYPADMGDILPRAAFLADKYNLMLIDFRYFGESGGYYSTLGVREVDDLLAAVAYLKLRGMEKIGVYGLSMGGAAALMAVPRTNDIDAIVSEAAYADLVAMSESVFAALGPARKPFGWMTARVAGLALGVDLRSASPMRAVAGTKLPILIINGRRDDVVPFSNALALKEALKDDLNAEYSFSDSEMHGQASTEFSKIVGDFFAKHLQ